MSQATAANPSADRSPECRTAGTAHFSIVARGDPGALPRVIELFAKRGLVPTRCQSALDPSVGGMLAIDLEMEGMDRDLADQIGRCLRQIPLVDCVLTSIREQPAA